MRRHLLFVLFRIYLNKYSPFNVFSIPDLAMNTKYFKLMTGGSDRFPTCYIMELCMKQFRLRKYLPYAQSCQPTRTVSFTVSAAKRSQKLRPYVTVAS